MREPVFWFHEGTLEVEQSFVSFAGAPDPIDIEEGLYDLLFDRLGGRIAYTTEERPHTGWLRWLRPRVDVHYHYVAATDATREEFATQLRAHFGLTGQEASLEELVEQALRLT